MKEQIIYLITEDMIQTAASANCGRELTDKELKRLRIAFFDSDTFFDQVYSALIEVAREVMDESNTDWSSVDEDYKNMSVEEVFSYQLFK